MLQYDIGAGKRAIHSLQNHDDMMFHFNYDQQNPGQLFMYGGQLTPAQQIEGRTVALVKNFTDRFNISLLDGGGGICTTMATIICRRLGLDCWNNASSAVGPVSDAALTLAAFNGFQPGLLQISAWDLLGILALQPSDLDAKFLADADCRWLNRGGYDLMDYTNGAAGVHGVTGLPRAKSLFGSIPAQLKNPDSYASKLKTLLAVRQALNISQGFLNPNVAPTEVASSVVVLPISWYDNVAINYIALLIVNFGDAQQDFSLKLNFPVNNMQFTGVSSVTEVWPASNTTYPISSGAIQIGGLKRLSARLLKLTVNTTSA